MTTEADFLHTMRLEPENDLVRLAYADWLDEAGDPRGDFVRAQIALDRCNRHDADWLDRYLDVIATSRRCRSDFHDGPPRRFHRGVEVPVFTPGELRTWWDTATEEQRDRLLAIDFGATDSLESLVAHPAMRQVTGLRLGERQKSGGNRLGPEPRVPPLKQLTTLSLTANQSDLYWLMRRHWPKLIRLSCMACSQSQAGSFHWTFEGAESIPELKQLAIRGPLIPPTDGNPQVISSTIEHLDLSGVSGHVQRSSTSLTALRLLEQFPGLVTLTVPDQTLYRPRDPSPRGFDLENLRRLTHLHGVHPTVLDSIPELPELTTLTLSPPSNRSSEHLTQHPAFDQIESLTTTRHLRDLRCWPDQLSELRCPNVRSLSVTTGVLLNPPNPTRWRAAFPNLERLVLRADFRMDPQIIEWVVTEELARLRHFGIGGKLSPQELSTITPILANAAQLDNLTSLELFWDYSRLLQSSYLGSRIANSPLPWILLTGIGSERFFQNMTLARKQGFADRLLGPRLREVCDGGFATLDPFE